MHKTKQIIIGVFLVTALFGLGTYHAHAALTNAQINAIVSLLESFGGNTQTIENVRAALEGRAQEGSVDTDVACISITHDLHIGQNDAKTGGEVSKLQTFLRETGDFQHSSITGYYGPVTERAVQRFQERRNVVSSGTAETTGYGVVGPATRAAISDIPCRNSEVGNDNTNNRTFSITITEPNEKKLFSVGDVMDIQWNSRNIDTVDVLMYSPSISGASSTVNISGTILNTGSFTWPIDADALPKKDGKLADSYAIRVQGGTYPEVYDVSDTDFNITSDASIPVDLSLRENKGNDASSSAIIAILKGFPENRTARRYVASIDCQDNMIVRNADGENKCGASRMLYTGNMHPPEDDHTLWEVEVENTGNARAGVTFSVEAFDGSGSYIGGDTETTALAPGGTIAHTQPVSLEASITDAEGASGDKELTAFIGGHAENETVGYWMLFVGCPFGFEVESDGADVCGTDMRINTNQIPDPTEDYLMLNALVSDNRTNTKTNAEITVSLIAYDQRGVALGVDTYTLTVE